MGMVPLPLQVLQKDTTKTPQRREQILHIKYEFADQREMKQVRRTTEVSARSMLPTLLG